ncbi:hypothetical protein ES702_02352 [subsurface metagenome]
MYWLQWLGNNTSILIAVMALIVSIYAVRITAREFRLRVRPFIGVMKVNPIPMESDKDRMKFKLELVNVGVLPAVILHYSLDYFVDGVEQEGEGVSRTVNLVLLPQQKYFVVSQEIGNLSAALLRSKKVLSHRFKIAYADPQKLHNYFYEEKSEFKVDVKNKTGSWVPLRHEIESH